MHCGAYRRDLREVPAKGDHRDQRARRRARSHRRRDARARARLRASARRHLPAQARAAAGGDRRRASRSSAAPATRSSSRCSGSTSTRSRSTGRTASSSRRDDDESAAPCSRASCTSSSRSSSSRWASEARAFLDSLEVPARRPARAAGARECCSASRRRSRRSSRPTSTSRSTSSPRRRRSGTPSRCSASGGRSSSVLSARRAAALVAVVALLVAWDAGAGVLPGSGTGRRRPRHRSARHAGNVRCRGLRCRRSVALVLHAAAALVALSVSALPRGVRRARSTSEALGADRARLLVHELFEALSWVVADRADHPVGRRALGLARPDRLHRHRAPSLFDRVSIAFRFRARSTRPTRPAGHPLLRAVPRRGGPLRATAALDVARHGRPALR